MLSERFVSNYFYFICALMLIKQKLSPKGRPPQSLLNFVVLIPQTSALILLIVYFKITIAALVVIKKMTLELNMIIFSYHKRGKFQSRIMI